MTAALAVVQSAAPKVKRTAAKRHRQFFVEARTLPSRISELFGGKPSEWYRESGPWDRLQQARNDLDAVEALHGYSAGLFFPGTEYRVRRTDTKRV